MGYRMGGTVYGRGASFEYRRHAWTKTIEIAKGKCKIIPLIAYTSSTPPASTINDYGGNAQTVYQTPKCQEGSRINRILVDFLITPKLVDSKDHILDFYTARIKTSFHDIKSGEIRGLSIHTDGKTPLLDPDDNPAVTNTTGKDVDTTPPELTFDKTKFDYSVTIKHWWRGMRKTVLPAGQPAAYKRWESVPRKCKRINRGTFYGVVCMNDSDTAMNVEYKIKFNEIPLID